MTNVNKSYIKIILSFFGLTNIQISMKLLPLSCNLLDTCISDEFQKYWHTYETQTDHQVRLLYSNAIRTNVDIYITRYSWVPTCGPGMGWCESRRSHRVTRIM